MKKSSSGFQKKLKEGWAAKSPVLLFVISFFGIMVLFYIFIQSAFYQQTFQPIIVRINAQVASFILNIFGAHTVASNDLIASNAGSISIKRGCDALLPIFLFMSAVLAFPAKWKDKLLGLGVGVGLLLVVNLVRIISLFWIQLYFPSAFDLMHLEVWQVIFIILGVLFWIYWMNWTQRKYRNKSGKQKA